MKTNKAAGMDCAIIADALRYGGNALVSRVHRFCAEVYNTLKPSSQSMDHQCNCTSSKEGRSLPHDKLQRNIIFCPLKLSLQQDPVD